MGINWKVLFGRTLTHAWRRRREAAPSSVRYARLCVEQLEERNMPVASAGASGINAIGMSLPGGIPLEGLNVVIGQFESSRPGMPGFDTLPALLHTEVKPAAVFLGVQQGTKDDKNEIKDHAIGVAGVMIASTFGDEGIAPKATLYSAGVVPSLPSDIQSAAAVAMQKVATFNNDASAAINVSWGTPPTDGLPDGYNQLTAFVDWSARLHEVLYVVGGNEFDGGASVPTDEFNGVTVSMTVPDAPLPGGVFRKMHLQNRTDEDAVGPRHSVDLAAPGEPIHAQIGGDVLALQARGTSFAAPHVTGTVALLQQYANNRIAAGAAGWTTAGADGRKDARRHEVMKAVLLNSADKLAGARDPGEKEIIDAAGSVWRQSIARDGLGNFGEKIPLDLQMGAGQLNGIRALQQFDKGEKKPAGGSAPVGWDYNSLNAEDTHNTYQLGKLKGGTWVAITVTWDRIVTLAVDNGVAGLYDPGDEFSISPLADLDLYLLPKGATHTNQRAVGAASRSKHDNVEHLFFQLPAKDADYEFWVDQNSAVGATLPGRCNDRFTGVAGCCSLQFDRRASRLHCRGRKGWLSAANSRRIVQGADGVGRVLRMRNGTCIIDAAPVSVIDAPVILAKVIEGDTLGLTWFGLTVSSVWGVTAYGQKPTAFSDVSGGRLAASWPGGVQRVRPGRQAGPARPDQDDARPGQGRSEVRGGQELHHGVRLA